MLSDVFTNVVHALTRRLQALLELALGFYLGLAERHLYAAMSVNFAFARRFDGQENHVLELIHDRRLHSVGLRRWHAPERLQGQYHVAEAMHGVVDVFADFQVSF